MVKLSPKQLQHWYLELEGVFKDNPTPPRVQRVIDGLFDAYLDAIRDEVRSSLRDTDPPPGSLETRVSTTIPAPPDVPDFEEDAAFELPLAHWVAPARE